MSEHLAQIVAEIPASAVPVACDDLPAPIVNPELVASAAIEDATAHVLVAAATNVVEAALAAMKGSKVST